MTASMISVIDALGWALIQSFWQALAILVILRVLLALLRHAPAAARYNLSLGALALTFAAFVVTFYDRWASLQPFEMIYQEQGPLAGPSRTLPSVAGSLAPSASFFTPERWLTAIVVIYLAGLLFFAGKMIRDAGFLWYLRGSRQPPFDPAWEKCLSRLCASWAVARSVRLYMSRRIDVPVVAGYLKPVIYLPFTLAGSLDTDQVEAILLHELAHIRRHDFLINIFQTLAETALFFNPFVWLMSRSIRAERENCCDDLVLSHLDAGVYASALLALEENRHRGSDLVLAATGHKKQQLFHRIKRMMEMKTKKLNVLQKLLVLLVLSGSLASLSWLAPDRKAANTPITLQQTAASVSGTVPVKDTSAPAAASADSAPAAGMKLPPPPPPSSVLPPPTPPLPLSVNKIEVRVDTLTGARVYTITGYPAKDTDSALKAYTVPGFLLPPDSLKGLTQAYFQSPEWKEYQRQLVRYATEMAKKAEEYGKDARNYFNSPEGKKYQQELDQYAQSLNAYFHSSDWNEKVEDIKNHAKEIRRQFADMHAQKVLDSLGRTLSSHGLTLASAGHTVNADRIASMLQHDGLVSDRNNFRMRLNDKGLFIDGKKQDRKYFEKYRSLVGRGTSVEIRRKNGNTDTSISTHKESDENH